MRLLVVEDDDGIAAPLVSGLRREGFEVERVATGADALAADEPDLMLLDLRLPDMDGYAVAREIRARSRVPIIIVTARGEEVDRVVGLEIGADDYVVKPFGLRELIARIHAVMRRVGEAPPAAAEESQTSLQVGDLAIDRRRHEATLSGEPLALTPKEFALLDLL
ncbi:MAG: response regulator transcription factor, partial [Thermoleophilia bacterium]